MKYLNRQLRKRKKKIDTNILKFSLSNGTVEKAKLRLMRETESTTIPQIAQKLIELWVNRRLYDECGNLI